ncbi:MAG: adenylate/guanylate cyclase domain-containing protein [Gammaproteobacteria bacterium]|nr:adenylate/guanylate cyclase domain-containing protein [Gammaproteobacteria bacterium]
MTQLESRIRLGSGILLAVYVAQHLLNHAFGIVSIEAAEIYRKSVGAVFQATPVLIAFYASVMLHAAVALRSVYRRSSLRMPLWQWLQLLLGLSIPPLVAGHAIGNRGYALLGDLDPNYYYVVTSMALDPVTLIKLALLVPLVWLHMAIGLHFWLRLKSAYSRFLPWLFALAVLVPALALTGILHMLQQASTWAGDRDRLDQIYAALREMSRADLRFLQGLETQAWIAMAALLGLTLLARQLRLWRQARRGSYRIEHPARPGLRAVYGPSLLDALRQARVPHASVCGGRGRCTTCRVRVGEGLAQLPPPNDLERAALQRIDAPADVRLACQLHPRTDLAITPLVQAGQTLAASLHAGGVQGHEEYVVAMFVDMRGSTSLGERVLAYDVVFILNRFFTELSEALQQSHGHYAQFAGDGLMALYGLDPARKPHACADALAGAREMFRRIQALNLQLQREFGESVKMGIGIHGGEAIVGTMGPPKTPLLTAVGDNINIAARLEAQTKTLDCDLIVSLETLEREAIEVAPESLREVEVRGRENHVRVSLLACDSIPSTDAP